MNTNFPESMFLPVNEESVKFGKDISSKRKIFFCGIARNVEKTIKKNIERIVRTAEVFSEYKIFIYENDSNDNTPLILSSDSRVISTCDRRESSNYWNDINNGTVNHHYFRCVELAKCRNKYLDHARNYYGHYDYLCVIDLDIHGWSYDGFYDSVAIMEAHDNCSSVSSYGVLSDFNNHATLEDSKRYLMYDSFSFRPLGYNQMLTSVDQARFNSIQPVIDNPIQVRCNFGGLAIYKMKHATQSKYQAKFSKGLVDVEHVHFYDMMSKNNGIHIFNQKMISSYSKHKFVEG